MTRVRQNGESSLINSVISDQVLPRRCLDEGACMAAVLIEIKIIDADRTKICHLASVARRKSCIETKIEPST